jgi:hypothetical protein
MLLLLLVVALQPVPAAVPAAGGRPGCRLLLQQRVAVLRVHKEL